MDNEIKVEELTVKETAQAHYKKLLSSHDKYYQYSDDGRVFRKGQAEYKVLQTMQQLIDVDKIVWNEYFKEGK